LAAADESVVAEWHTAGLEGGHLPPVISITHHHFTPISLAHCNLYAIRQQNS